MDVRMCERCSNRNELCHVCADGEFYEPPIYQQEKPAPRLYDLRQVSQATILTTDCGKGNFLLPPDYTGSLEDCTRLMAARAAGHWAIVEHV